VGTVEEIQQTEDPVVRQFIEGRPEMQSARDTTALSAGGL
jgi:ABC-type transporter Mla maintaining outer membrane lipid asymmetry ATPase subunit MlaF